MVVVADMYRSTVETVRLVQDRELLRALANALLPLLVCVLAAAAAGLALSSIG